MVLDSCQSEQAINQARYFVNGKGLYERLCKNCHNTDGKGLADLIPPLTDSLFLKKHRSKLACYIKFGIQGEVNVGQKIYNSAMPGNASLSNIEIAELITYICNSFENKQGLYDVTMVEKDLSSCPWITNLFTRTFDGLMKLYALTRKIY